MKTHVRKNGARDLVGREFQVFKRLVAAGHNDVAIAEMLGRTDRSVRGLREYYGMTISDRYKITGKRYSPEEEEIVKEKLTGWVQLDRLSPAEMAQRLAVQHPPGLNRATVTKWLKRLGPGVWREHLENMKGRRARAIQRRHQRGRAQLVHKGRATIGVYSQQRDPSNQKFLKKEQSNAPCRTG